MRFLILMIFLIGFSFSIYPQTQSTPVLFKSYEDSLKKLAFNIVNAKVAIEKQSAIYAFDQIFNRMLHAKGSFEYPFDSLRHISVLNSPDKSFKIFTWHLLKDDFTYKHFGYIQFKSGDSIKIYKLIDRSDFLTNAQYTLLDYKNWFGAHYYSLIHRKYKRKNYYILLGWDGNNNFTNKKVIEVLTFDIQKNPVFGDTIFNLKENKKIARMVFEYDKQAVMLLRYRPDKKLIVFDHLSPRQKDMEGMFIFYGPDMTYDALKFKKGKLNLMENVKMKNEN